MICNQRAPKRRKKTTPTRTSNLYIERPCTVGRFIMESSLQLPREYLSYSAIHLFEKDKEQFRARYYRDEKQRDTVYSLFGREVHSKIEENPDLFENIPTYDQKELKLEANIDGVPVLGYIDSFCSDCYTFADYKTGIRKADGTPRWDAIEVQKLNQLPFYSLLIQENYSKVAEKCRVVWLETQFKEEDQMLTSKDPELELTGHFEIFEREIEPWERDRIREWTLENAKAISEDYKQYLENA